MTARDRERYLRGQRSDAARRGWETRRARIDQTLTAVEHIAASLRSTADGLRIWSRERTTASAGVHPVHAANRLDKLADQLSSTRRSKGDR